jgi:hypothetical protein
MKTHIRKQIEKATKVRGTDHQYALFFLEGEEGVLASDASETHNYVIVKADKGAVVGCHGFTLDYLIDGVWVTGKSLEAQS